jgi:hypothetical protein
MALIIVLVGIFLSVPRLTPCVPVAARDVRP